MKRLGTAAYLGNFEPGTPEWGAARAVRVGGSEVAALLGLSPWASYFSLWHEKSGTIDGNVDSDLMEWGRILEEPIARRFARRHPEFAVRKCGTYVNIDRDYQLISPDRLLFSRDGGQWETLEIKTATRDEEWGDDGTDEVPLHYRCQKLWALDTFGIPQGRMAVYFGGGDYREYVISYDETDSKILRKYAGEFVETLYQGIMPDIDGHTATYRAVRHLHPDIDRVDVALSPEVALPYLAALEGMRYAEEEKRRAGAEVLTALGFGRRALWDDRAIATRVPGRGDNPPYLRANPLPKTKEIA